MCIDFEEVDLLAASLTVSVEEEEKSHSLDYPMSTRKRRVAMKRMNVLQEYARSPIDERYITSNLWVEFIYVS